MAKIDGRTLDHKALEHIRILAVRRVVEDDEAPSVVMESLGFSRTAIYPWLRKFEQEGWDALVERIAAGPEPKLTEKQRQQVKRWILGKDPRQYGFDFGLWSRRIVQALIKERMRVGLGLTAVGRLLASLDITPQKPLRRLWVEGENARGGNLRSTAEPQCDQRGQRARRILGSHLHWQVECGSLRRIFAEFHERTERKDIFGDRRSSGPYRQAGGLLLGDNGGTPGVTSLTILCAGFEPRRICLGSYEEEWGLQEAIETE